MKEKTMVNILMSLLLAGLLILSCSKSKNPTEPDNNLDYFPLAIGNAWNFKIEYYDSNGNITKVRYRSDVIVKDSIASDGYKFWGFADKIDSLSFDILDSACSWHGGYIDKNDTVFGDFEHPLFFHHPFEGKCVSYINENQIGIIWPQNPDDSVVTFDTILSLPDTTFYEFVGDYIIGDTIFNDCYKVKHNYKGTQFLINQTTMERIITRELIHKEYFIQAPGIGFVYGEIENKSKYIIKGFRIGGNETWLNI
jgi:hypothetical protein